MQKRLIIAVAGLLGMSAVVWSDRVSAQSAHRALDSERAAKLHRLTGEALAADRARPARSREVRALIDALDALDRELAAMEASSADARSRSVGDRRRVAEAALARLRARMQPEKSEQVGALFLPLWTEVDAALAAPSSRRGGNVAEARRRIREAKRGGSEVHSMSLGAFSAGETN
jgi:hypothetical protein